jgi:hypothetical protein
MNVVKIKISCPRSIACVCILEEGGIGTNFRQEVEVNERTFLNAALNSLLGSSSMNLNRQSKVFRSCHFKKHGIEVC